MNTASNLLHSAPAGSFTAFLLGSSRIVANLFDAAAQAIEQEALASLASLGTAEGYLLGDAVEGPEAAIEIHSISAQRPRRSGPPFVLGCYRSRAHVGTELSPADIELARECLPREGVSLLLVVDPGAADVPQACFHLFQAGAAVRGGHSVVFPLDVPLLGELSMRAAIRTASAHSRLARASMTAAMQFLFAERRDRQLAAR